MAEHYKLLVADAAGEGRWLVGTYVAADNPEQAAEELERKLNAYDDLLAACEEFVRKVECGEARSVRSYAQMKAAIAKARGT